MLAFYYNLDGPDCARLRLAKQTKRVTNNEVDYKQIKVTRLSLKIITLYSLGYRVEL